MTDMESNDSDPRRAEAIARLKKKREFYQHLLVYVLVNAFLIAIWYFVAGRGFFWPIFPLGGWGIGLIMHSWDTFSPGRPTEDQIRKEINRLN
ncbi:2TM domain-containing protein [Mycobacterium sp. MMS18-G62]